MISLLNANKINLSKFLFLIVFILISLTLIKLQGSADNNIWLNWINNIKLYGIFDGYDKNSADYPPLSSVMLFLSQEIFNHGAIGDRQAIKLFGLCLLFISYLISLKISNNFFLAFSMFIFFTLSAGAMGYLDVYFLPFLLLSLFSLWRNKILWFSFFYTLTIFIKWQPLILAPFLLIYIIKKINLESNYNKRSRIVFNFVSPPIIIFAILCVLWGFTSIRDSFLSAASHNLLSANALNFNWIVTYLVEIIDPAFSDRFNSNSGRIYYIDSKATGYLRFISLGIKIVFISFYLFALNKYRLSNHSFENFLKLSSLGYLSYFMFNIGVHENHLFMIIPLLFFLSILQKEFLTHYIFFAMAFNINLFIFYGLSGSESIDRIFLGLDLTLPISIFIFVYFLNYYYLIISKINSHL